MYVCNLHVYMCVCAYMYSSMFDVHKHRCIYTSVHKHTYAYSYVYVCVCVLTHINTCIHAYMQMHRYSRICIAACLYTCAYVCVHACIHTCIQA